MVIEYICKKCLNDNIFVIICFYIVKMPIYGTYIFSEYKTNY